MTTSNGYSPINGLTPLPVAEMDLPTAPRGPHRFQVGNPGGPGRPRKAHELAVLDAIKADWPAERILDALDTAFALAVETRSARNIMAVLGLVLSYQVGRPTQRIDTSSAVNLQALLANVDVSRPLMPDFDDDNDPG